MDRCPPTLKVTRTVPAERFSPKEGRPVEVHLMSKAVSPGMRAACAEASWLLWHPSKSLLLLTPQPELAQAHDGPAVCPPVP